MADDAVRAADFLVRETAEQSHGRIVQQFQLSSNRLGDFDARPLGCFIIIAACA